MELYGSLPIQRLPESKKNQEWKEACVKYIVGQSKNGPMDVYGESMYDEMKSWYDLYNGIYDQKDLAYVTNPYRQVDGFPAKASNYNIIKPKIDLLLGEETKRPFKGISVTRTSDSAASERQQMAHQMIHDYIMGRVTANLGEDEAAEFQQKLETGEIQTPEQIQQIINKEHKDIAEQQANHAMKHLIKKHNIQHETFKGWKHGLIGGKIIYYAGNDGVSEKFECVDPLTFTHDVHPGMEFIDEASWCCRNLSMTDAQIYDFFYNRLEKKELDKVMRTLEDRQNKGAGGVGRTLGASSVDYYHTQTKIIGGKNGITKNPFSTSLDYDVYHCCWKGFKKIGFVTVVDEMGEYEIFEVDESYKETGDEIDVEWDWIVWNYEGFAIDDMVVGVKPIKGQIFSVDNPNGNKLPYTGVIFNNTNTQAKSLVGILKPLQYMYIILWYRLELALSRDKGKVPLVDVTQIPKSMGIDVAKWMHYLSALGVAFVNPYEEEWNIPGREGGKPSQFNQFTALDLTMSNVIGQYIDLMAKIEQMVQDLSGITKQREGSIAPGELVGNVNTSVAQSAYTTEPLYWLHTQVKTRALTMLLNSVKSIWRDSDKQFLSYIYDDGTRSFIRLTDDFFLEDMDIFIEDGTKTMNQLQELKMLLQPAMQNGASILDAAEIITLENVSEVKNKLKEIEIARQEMMAQQQQQDQENQERLIQMQNEVKEQEFMLEQSKLELDKYKTDQDNQTKIVVAQLNAYRGVRELDQDGDGTPDPIQIADQALAQQKLDQEILSKRMEMANKSREEKSKQELERKKLDMEKSRMDNEIKLQKMKDDAAMAREKLKSKTALKNKVVGEK